jgi:hypothetical protein
MSQTEAHQGGDDAGQDERHVGSTVEDANLDDEEQDEGSHWSEGQP